MIDTVVLLLSSDMYKITDPEKFVPSARWIINSKLSAVHGIQSKQNPTKKELFAGIYKPRLTLSYRTNTRNTLDIVLKVELSLPKLFYGNNFQELKGKDLQPLLQRLSDTLGQMEVIVDPADLARAPIVAVHYSKNIILKDGSTPYHYINKIKESNIKMSLDTNQTDYRNEGHSYKWHCNSYEIVFYDKIKDLEKAKQSEKRAIEKDNAIQLDLFPKLRKKKKLEVLRMEVRLNKRAKMKQLFEKLGIKSDLSLASLFKPVISKKVLLYYLDQIRSSQPLLDCYRGNDKALLASLKLNNPNLRTHKIFQIFGLIKALEKSNPREIKLIFPNLSSASWNRLLADIKKVKLDFTNDPFKIIKWYITNSKSTDLN